MAPSSAISAEIDALFRYPVKSMAGEQIDVTAVGERGVLGDRAYALVDGETGKVASAKNPRRWGMLFGCRAVYVDEPRDAADAAFATIFGGVVGSAPKVSIEAIPNAQGVLMRPQHVPYALSTDGPLGL